MSSLNQPCSQASTVIESADPPSFPTSEKTDPWLVSFSPDDPDNPLVRFSGLL